MNYIHSSPFQYPVTNHAFLMWMFFTPLWRTIISSVKKTNKWKRNNLKMPSFWQYLTVQIRLTERKTKCNYHFSSIVKNDRKDGLKPSKVRRGKWLAQIFRKDLTERKLERTWMKIMLSASLSLVFFTQSSQYQIFKANTYSMLTNTNRTWTASVVVLN